MFSLLSAASVINVENLLDRLLNYGIELGKSLLAALVIARWKSACRPSCAAC